MNKFAVKLTALAMAASLAAGCSQNTGPNEAGGTLVGAAAGGLIGSQFGSGSGKLAATGIGVLLGGLLGNKIGKQMDDEDKRRAMAAQNAAYGAPIGQQIVWNNPNNDHSGSIVPTREGTDAAGNQCREFQTTVTIGGQAQQAYGQACRQPDGSWKVVQ